MFSFGLDPRAIQENKRNLILEWAASRTESRLIICMFFGMGMSAVVWIIFARMWWQQTASTVERFSEHAWASRGEDARRISESLTDAKRELTFVLFWYQIAPLLELLQVNLALEFARDRTSVVTRSSVRHAIYLGLAIRFYASFLHLPKAATLLSTAKHLLPKRRKVLAVSGISLLDDVRELWEETPNRIDDVLLTLAPLIFTSHARRFWEWITRLGIMNRELWSDTTLLSTDENLALVPPDLTLEEYDIILAGIENDTRCMFINIFVGIAWCLGLWWWKALKLGNYAIFVAILVSLWIFLGCVPRIVKLEELAEKIRRNYGASSFYGNSSIRQSARYAAVDSQGFEAEPDSSGLLLTNGVTNGHALAQHNRRYARSYDSAISPTFCCTYWFGWPYNSYRRNYY